MRLTSHLTALALLGAGLGLCAKGPSLDFKIGSGVFVGDPGSNRNMSLQHLALQVSLPAGKGSVFAEIQTRLIRSDSYDNTQLGKGYALNTSGQVVTGVITAYRINPTSGRPEANGNFDSVDLRRDNLDGYSINLGYRMPLGLEGLTVHGGLSLHALRAQQDVSGGLKVIVDRNVTTPVVLGQENFYTQHEKRSLMPGAFAGARYQVNGNLFVEGNVSLLAWKDVKWMPFSYTGQAPATELLARRKGSVEFSMGMTF